MKGTPLLTWFLVALLMATSPLSLSHGSGHLTQVTTPVVTYPVTPAPAACTVEPRSAESLRAIFETPAATQLPKSETRAGDGGASPVAVPVGQPASREIEAEITAIVYELYACFNAGDSRSAFALVTDTFLRDFAARGMLTAQDIAFLTAGPEPVPVEDRTQLLAITDVSVLDTGHVGAFVIASDRFNGADTFYMTLVQQADRWLVDQITDFL